MLQYVGHSNICGVTISSFMSLGRGRATDRPGRLSQELRSPGWEIQLYSALTNAFAASN